MPGLDGQKMSKSYNNTIALRDDTDSVATKLRTFWQLSHVNADIFTASRSLPQGSPLDLLSYMPLYKKK